MAKKKRVNPHKVIITEADAKRAAKKAALLATKQVLTMASMVLMDNFGFHLDEDIEHCKNTHDKKSLRYFLQCLERKKIDIEDGTLKLSDYTEVLREELGIEFTIDD